MTVMCEDWHKEIFMWNLRWWRPWRGHNTLQDRDNFWTDGTEYGNAESCVIVSIPSGRVGRDKKRILRARSAKRQSALNNKLYLIIFDFKMEMILWKAL